MRTRNRTWWLRRDLLVRLMLPLLGLVLITGAVGTYTAKSLTDRVFDRWLLDAARSVAAQVRFQDGNALLDLPSAAISMLRYDERDQIFYSAVQGTRLITGESGIPESGSRQSTYTGGDAFDAMYEGHVVRVALARVHAPSGAEVHVLVAETVAKRERAQQEILLMLAPVTALLLAAAFAIRYAVQRTLRPLQAIAARLDEQSHASLQPIDAQELPRELMPFATALNNLLSRIRSLLAREQQFAATVAHQLRTPLAGLQLGVTRASEAPDLSGSRLVLAELGHTVQRTARMVQQLLALGRMDREMRNDLEFVPTDIVALTHEVGTIFLETAAANGLALELEAPDAPILVPLHAELMAEALGNLLDNALRYTPRGGRVLIEFDTVPPAIHVSDSGPGVPPDQREAVFERFVRGRHAESEGSGLGLAIVRDIVAIHDGTIELTESRFGGARVTLFFQSKYLAPDRAIG